jgi:hypothetical protein
MSKQFWLGVWRSKTMWLGHATVVLGMVTATYPDLLTKAQVTAYLFANGILGYVFRIKADGSLTEKGQQ